MYFDKFNELCVNGSELLFGLWFLMVFSLIIIFFIVFIVYLIYRRIKRRCNFKK